MKIVYIDNIPHEVLGDDRDFDNTIFVRPTIGKYRFKVWEEWNDSMKIIDLGDCYEMGELK